MIINHISKKLFSIAKISFKGINHPPKAIIQSAHNSHVRIIATNQQQLSKINHAIIEQIKSERDPFKILVKIAYFEDARRIQDSDLVIQSKQKYVIRNPQRVTKKQIEQIISYY